MCPLRSRPPCIFIPLSRKIPETFVQATTLSSYHAKARDCLGRGSLDAHRARSAPPVSSASVTNRPMCSILKESKDHPGRTSSVGPVMLVKKYLAALLS